MASEFTIAHILNNMVAAPAGVAAVKTVYESEDGILLCYGITKPTGTGYAPGCIFMHTDGGAGTAVYINEGTLAAADFENVWAADQQAALTTELTDLTHTAPGTPDYALQDLVQPAGYGFVSKDEGNSVLKVVQANKVRIAEIETALQAIGLLA
jgi:hypothetical protein